MTARIREATPEDAEAMARVRVDTWRATYAGIMPADYLAALSYEQTAVHLREVFLEHPMPGSFIYLAEDPPGEVVGIAIGGEETDGDPEYLGEIYVLYILPDCQGRGTGRALVDVCARRLLAAGIDSMLIWVLERNPARRFYEALGGRPVRSKQSEWGGAVLNEVGYGWKDLNIWKFKKSI